MVLTWIPLRISIHTVLRKLECAANRNIKVLEKDTENENTCFCTQPKLNAFHAWTFISPRGSALYAAALVRTHVDGQLRHYDQILKSI